MRSVPDQIAIEVGMERDGVSDSGRQVEERSVGAFVADFI